MSFDTSDIEDINADNYSMTIIDEIGYEIHGNWNNSETKNEFDKKLLSEENVNTGESEGTTLDLKNYSMNKQVTHVDKRIFYTVKNKFATFDLVVNYNDYELNKRYYGIFVIEPGDLKIKITENGIQMSGTKTNDLISEFRNTEFESEEAMDSYIDKMIKNDDMFASYLASIQLFKKLIELESTPQVSQLTVKEQIDKIINSYPSFVKQHYPFFNEAFDQILKAGDIPPVVIASVLEYFL